VLLNEILGEKVGIVGWGFVGSAVGRVLSSRGSRIHAICRYEPKEKDILWNNQRRLYVTNGNEEKLRAALVGVDSVIFCAGGLLPLEATLRPLDDVTTLMSGLIGTLQAMEMEGVGRMLLVSSGGTVYGNAREVPTPEDAPLIPTSAYGASRVAAELYAKILSHRAGINLVVARCSNIYGWISDPNRRQGIVSTAIHRLLDRRPVHIFGNGTELRDYIHIDDASKAIVDLLTESQAEGVFNLGSGVGHSTLEVVQRVAKCLKVDDLEISYLQGKPEIQSSILSISKIQELINFKPRSLDKGISDVIEKMSSI
jgi:UDP-glucose 4-epimerase